MKKILLLILISLCCFSSIAGDNACAGESITVYVVLSNNAYAYHKSLNCPAVKRATHPVACVTLEEASQKMGRTPCGICYR